MRRKMFNHCHSTNDLGTVKQPPPGVVKAPACGLIHKDLKE